MFDLNAAIEEDNAEPFRFHFGDGNYELPAHVDLRAVAAMSDGRLNDGLRLLLGPEQWERMQRETAVFDDRALTALFGGYMAHIGTSLPESLASTGS